MSNIYFVVCVVKQEESKGRLDESVFMCTKWTASLSYHAYRYTVW